MVFSQNLDARQSRNEVSVADDRLRISGGKPRAKGFMSGFWEAERPMGSFGCASFQNLLGLGSPAL